MSHVIALVDDLLFLSRIREAARGCGAEVRAVRAAKDVVAGARDGARLVLVEADRNRIPWEDAVRALRSDPAGASLPVVAFLSHVHAERAEAAQTRPAVSSIVAPSSLTAAPERPTGCTRGGAGPPRRPCSRR